MQQVVGNPPSDLSVITNMLSDPFLVQRQALFLDFGLVGVQLIMSAAILIPLALIVEGTSDTEFTLDLLYPLLYAGIPANAGTFSLMAAIVKRATPTVAASVAYLIPLFGVFFSWAISGEVLGLVEAIGGLLVVGGVYLVVTANARAAASQATVAPR